MNFVGVHRGHMLFRSAADQSLSPQSCVRLGLDKKTSLVTSRKTCVFWCKLQHTVSVKYLL